MLRAAPGAGVRAGDGLLSGLSPAPAAAPPTAPAPGRAAARTPRAAARCARAGHGHALGDVLVRRELITREVDFEPVGQPVPPVEIDALARHEDLAAQQFAPQQIVQHQRGDPALVPCGVPGVPVRPVVGCARVGAPTAADGAFDVGEEHGCHPGILAPGTDSRAPARAGPGHSPVIGPRPRPRGLVGCPTPEEPRPSTAARQRGRTKGACPWTRASQRTWTICRSCWKQYAGARPRWPGTYPKERSSRLSRLRRLRRLR